MSNQRRGLAPFFVVVTLPNEDLIIGEIYEKYSRGVNKGFIWVLVDKKGAIQRLLCVFEFCLATI